MNDTYTPPENPADPEAAALEMIVKIPTIYLAEPGRLLHPLIEVLQDLTGLLSAAGAFTGMVWPDAKQAAAAVAFDVCLREYPAVMLRERAANAASGADGMDWQDRERAARALRIAADILGDD